MSVVRLSEFRDRAFGKKTAKNSGAESAFQPDERRTLRGLYEQNKGLFKNIGFEKTPDSNGRSFECVFKGHDNRNLVRVVKTLPSGPDGKPSATLYVEGRQACEAAIGNRDILKLILCDLGKFISTIKAPPKALTNHANNISIREILLAEQVSILVANSGEARALPEGVTSLRKEFHKSSSLSGKLPESWPLKSHEHVILDNCFERFNNRASAMFLREPVSGAKCLQFGFFQEELFQVTASIAFEEGRYGVFKARWKEGDKDAFQSFADLSAAVEDAARFTGQELDNYTVASQDAGKNRGLKHE